MNIQEYSKKFMIFLNVLTSSIILWGQNNDGTTSKKLEKNHGIQPNYSEWGFDQPRCPEDSEGD